MSDSPVRVLGLSGSLRQGSYNTALLRAIAARVAPAIDVELFHLGELPLYDGDHDGEGRPAPVRALDEAIARADGLLVATPEYNFGTSGVLKNALDWASRPAFRAPINRKPAAVVSTATGELGGYRAHAQVRDTLRILLCDVFNVPELYVPRAGEAFDASGALVEPSAVERVDRFVAAWAPWMTAHAAGTR